MRSHPLFAASVTLLLLSLLCSRATAQAPATQPGLEVKGKLDAVTVYRGQALVTRLVDVPAGTGGGANSLREIVVTDLLAKIVANSLYAESADVAEVRLVLY